MFCSHCRALCMKCLLSADASHLEHCSCINWLQAPMLSGFWLMGMLLMSLTPSTRSRSLHPQLSSAAGRIVMSTNIRVTMASKRSWDLLLLTGLFAPVLQGWYKGIMKFPVSPFCILINNSRFLQALQLDYNSKLVSKST